MFAAVSAGAPAFTKIMLQFTANHGLSAVCVGVLKLFDEGKPVAFPTGTKSEHTGIWSDSFHSDNLLSSSKGHYSSASGSFKAGKGSEKVVVTMPKAVLFDSFSLQQHDGMGYSPKGFVVTGLRSDGMWVELRRETDFKFAEAGAVATFKTGTGI